MNDLAPIGRAVPEWVGKDADAMPPRLVRLRIFEAHGGRCYLTGRRIMPGDLWQLDHIRAVILGGENRERNLAPVLDAPHKVKSAADAALLAKDRRVRAKHFGAAGPSLTPMPFGRKSQWRRPIYGKPCRREAAE